MRRRRSRAVAGVVFVAGCAWVTPFSVFASPNHDEQQTERRLDAWGTNIVPTELPNWLNKSLDDAHAVEALAYGGGRWLAFATNNLPAPKDATSNAFKTRFALGTFKNTQGWIDSTLRHTTHSISAVAFGGGKWVAWADPRKVNAGEFHAVRFSASSFQSWAIDNANAGCFPTSFAFGQDDAKDVDLFYGVCNPKLLLQDGGAGSLPVKPAFAAKVFQSASSALAWMYTSLDSGYAVKALTYGQGQFVAYSEQRFVPEADTGSASRAADAEEPFAVFESFKGARNPAVFDYIKTHQATGYDLTAVAYSTREDTWLAYMELKDNRYVTIHKTCSYGCPLAYISDARCDPACNNASCEYDGGDCDGSKNPATPNPDELPSDPMCQPGCAMSSIGDRYCDEACWVEGCEFDGGDCECAKGCHNTNMIADGKCQVVCDVFECGYDGGDCGPRGSLKPANDDGGANSGAPLFFVDTSGLDGVVSAADAALTREHIANATAVWTRAVLSRQKPIVFSEALEASVLASCNFDKGFAQGDSIEASIYVRLIVSEIDGASGVRARAGPCVFDRATELPRIGTLQVDKADLDELLQRGYLKTIVAHELGHIIGIGSEWGRKRLIEGRGTVDPRYRGDGGRAGLLRLGGSGLPKLADIGGQGRYELHWRETVFGNELMTGSIGEGDQPLSVMTLMSLNDLGYQVDLAAAQPLTLTKPDEEAGYYHKDAIGAFGSDVVDGAAVIVNVIDVDGVVYVREPGKEDVLPGQVFITFPPASIAAMSIAGVLLLTVGALQLYANYHADVTSPMAVVAGSMRALPMPKRKKPTKVLRPASDHRDDRSNASSALPKAEYLGSV